MATPSLEPLWRPSPERSAASNMAQFAKAAAQAFPARRLQTYDELHAWSVQQPEEFWRFLLDQLGVRYSGEARHVLLPPGDNPGARFFPDVHLSFSDNLLRFADERPALVSVSEGRPPSRLSYAALGQKVAALATSLAKLGVGPGDRVAGYLPNLPEAVIAMLATTRLGAVWSSCSPDFGVQGILDRFGQIQPKVLFCANGYQYNGKRFDCLDKARQVASAIASIERVVVIPYLQDAARGIPELGARAVAWDDFLGDPAVAPPHRPMAFNDPLYVLYSSGTTGKPKCIVHGVGGTLLQHAKELLLHADLRRDDVIVYFTTCGWMMWNWLVSSLFVGATVVLYEGSPGHPTLWRLWELAEELGVTHFGTSAKFIGSCRGRISPKERLALPTLRVILSTGSPLLPEDFDWVYAHVKADLQLASISGGTDLISCFALGNPLLPVYRSELQSLGLGMDVAAFDEHDTPVVRQKGELVCRRPFVSMPIAFWDDPGYEKYRKAYFKRAPAQPELWFHGDYVELTGSQGRAGGVVIYGRSDATLNPGGVRIGTAEIYRLVETLPEVDDSIVIGQSWAGDVRVVLFVKTAAGVQLTPALVDKLKRVIRDGASPRHVPAVVLAVPAIPYTISGKKVELAVLDVVSGRQPKNTEALANPEALAHFGNRPELQA